MKIFFLFSYTFNTKLSLFLVAFIKYENICLECRKLALYALIKKIYFYKNLIEMDVVF